eukprot:gb/GECG01007168.1/.p1 GENE.gb/GECG01007168.1/~~gb/GECG01007168.1/.p1  ORF type:complete len:161 (+),score=14.26 gb/GECG01007168.1/:1-483(+)
MFGSQAPRSGYTDKEAVPLNVVMSRFKQGRDMHKSRIASRAENKGRTRAVAHRHPLETPTAIPNHSQTLVHTNRRQPNFDTGVFARLYSAGASAQSLQSRSATSASSVLIRKQNEDAPTEQAQSVHQRHHNSGKPKVSRRQTRSARSHDALSTWKKIAKL